MMSYLIGGEFVLKSMLWDFLKWPEIRGGYISGVLIRGVPMYSYSQLAYPKHQDVAESMVSV